MQIEMYICIQLKIDLWTNKCCRFFVPCHSILVYKCVVRYTQGRPANPQEGLPFFNSAKTKAQNYIFIYNNETYFIGSKLYPMSLSTNGKPRDSSEVIAQTTAFKPTLCIYTCIRSEGYKIDTTLTLWLARVCLQQIQSNRDCLTLLQQHLMTLLHLMTSKNLYTSKPVQQLL